MLMLANAYGADTDMRSCSKDRRLVRTSACLGEMATGRGPQGADLAARIEHAEGRDTPYPSIAPTASMRC